MEERTHRALRRLEQAGATEVEQVLAAAIIITTSITDATGARLQRLEQVGVNIQILQVCIGSSHL